MPRRDGLEVAELNLVMRSLTREHTITVIHGGVVATKVPYFGVKFTKVPPGADAQMGGHLTR